ncbi:hypothetical protein [Micromonospora chersina]|uniref:hypothetical protein n=1 Tax=Micromonospora chersina TaxID=47854 RepID=UPI003D8AE3F7
MTRDSAALIAQVIPVVAIALGLEIRSSVASMKETDLAASGKLDFWRLYPILVQLYMLVVLALAECEVIQVVLADGAEPGWLWVLRLAIVIAFLAPMADATYRLRQVLPNTRVGVMTRHVISALDLATSATVVLAAIFWPRV